MCRGMNIVWRKEMKGIILWFRELNREQQRKKKIAK
jgi:hypothetical protein